MKDFLGQEYDVGDYVVYATTSGRSPVMKFARVEKITQKERTFRDWKTQENVTVIEYQVGVREISNARGFIRFDTHDWKNGGKKPARVTYPIVDNIVKINYDPPEES